MSKGWYPVIGYEQCVGCLVCNDMCKHGVYKPDSETGKPKVVYGMAVYMAAKENVLLVLSITLETMGHWTLTIIMRLTGQNYNVMENRG